ncbi:MULTISPECIES: hypothetical protein [Pandoraea]|uniref:hypothetical protein n=1 Tax=Pandoraea TaxID=93217 RepID=UPI001F5CA75E|nr:MULTISPECIES: hypothetical protein [Pandoraea]
MTRIRNKSIIRLSNDFLIEIVFCFLRQRRQFIDAIFFHAVTGRARRKRRWHAAHCNQGGRRRQANPCLTTRIRLRTIPSHSTTPFQFASNDDFPHHASDSGLMAAIVPANSRSRFLRIG